MNSILSKEPCFFPYKETMMSDLKSPWEDE